MLDNLSPYYAGKEANLAPLEGRDGFEFLKGDVLDPDTPRWALEGIDVVYHLAAQPGGRVEGLGGARLHAADAGGGRC